MLFCLGGGGNDDFECASIRINLKAIGLPLGIGRFELVLTPRLVFKPHLQKIVNFILINDIRLLVIRGDLEQLMLYFLNGLIQVFTEEGDMVGPDFERRINKVCFHPLVALGG